MAGEQACRSFKNRLCLPSQIAVHDPSYLRHLLRFFHCAALLSVFRIFKIIKIYLLFIAGSCDNRCPALYMIFAVTVELMDPGAVADAAKGQPQQVLTAEALQAALAALLPGAPTGAAQLLSAPVQHTVLGQALQVQAEQQNLIKHPAKRKPARNTTEEPSSAAALPRPPPIKHEVYEDLEEKFNQLQAEREPKRHRGNPKGYHIKSFCKNPACGKQLNGGRTNRCEHCGFDLASHRRNSQLERLIKSGPLTHAQVRTTLRDAANEVHVRTGGKAVVLTLMYIEGGGPAPAQAIAYGKPAAAFVESRKELITNFEASCRDHFKEQQVPNPPQQQTNQEQPHPQQHHLGAAGSQLCAISPLLGPQFPGTSVASATAAARPCSLGPSSQFLSAVNAAAAAVATAPGSGPLQLGQSASVLPLVASAVSPHVQPVELESVIASTLADPEIAIARCRDARVSGDVLARLPQAMQLTVLMQAGLLPGEAASVVVELESRQRLQNLPALSLAALTQQQQQQHPSPATAAAAVIAPLQPLSMPPPAAALQASPQQLGAVLQHQVPPPQTWAAGLGSMQGPGTGAAPGPAIASGSGSGAAVPGGLQSYHHPASGGGIAPSGAAAAAAAVQGGGVQFFGPLQAALMAAAAVGAGADGVLGQDSGGVTATGPGGGHQPQHQFQGMMSVTQAGLGPDAGAAHHLGLQGLGQLPGHG
ncbi:hypothetical protein Vretimale_4824 [Volvox reticuliferus]|uniref:Uncharacterized protein n=1 Tax=Volvox reticuliferus TaxID=1737510 RepID=A0A8J4FFS5_9CHLO|nr:hypothetical protein Vretifemale_3386 [Volvox reticuliferus]GIL99672.1 hypothetical protein Vretimale_4824 [Volvox reticuliferus]